MSRRNNRQKVETKKEAPKSAPAKEVEQVPTKKPWYERLFPFWARLKIGKNRTTLVIDESPAYNKKTKKMEEGFVHREATHTGKSDYEKITPNPDKDDPRDLYLKRPRKLPKRMFNPHNKELDMPEELKKRYEPNNDKKKK